MDNQNKTHIASKVVYLCHYIPIILPSDIIACVIKMWYGHAIAFTETLAEIVCSQMLK